MADPDRRESDAWRRTTSVIFIALLMVTVVAWLRGGSPTRALVLPLVFLANDGIGPFVRHLGPGPRRTASLVELSCATLALGIAVVDVVMLVARLMPSSGRLDLPTSGVLAVVALANVAVNASKLRARGPVR